MAKMNKIEKFISSQNHFSNREELIDNFRSRYFWRAVAAELFGTFFLLTLSCGACLPIKSQDYMQTRPFEAALATGLVISTLIWGVGHISGAHFNPAVTIAHLVVRRTSILRTVIYILAQMLGATLGELILLLCVFPDGRGHMSVLDPHTELLGGQAFLVEFLGTYIFVFTIFMTCYDERDGFSGTKPFIIGCSLAANIMFAAQLTGGAMNPARAFGPALVNGKWNKHWVYWLGPCFGGIVAAFMFELLWNSRASMARAKALFLSHKYDPDAFEARVGKEVFSMAYTHTSNVLRTPAHSMPIVKAEGERDLKNFDDSDEENYVPDGSVEVEKH